MTRFIERLFEAKTLAGIFFLGFCATVTLYVGVDRELRECRRWSSRAFEALPRSKQEELRADWEVERDLAEALAEEAAPRD